jgi:hypothetical protein
MAHCARGLAAFQAFSTGQSFAAAASLLLTYRNVDKKLHICAT